MAEKQYILIQAQLQCKRCRNKFKSKTLKGYCDKCYREIRPAPRKEWKCKKCGNLIESKHPRSICDKCLAPSKGRRAKAFLAYCAGLSPKQFALEEGIKIAYARDTIWRFSKSNWDRRIEKEGLDTAEFRRRRAGCNG